MFQIKILLQAITPIIHSLISSHHCGLPGKFNENTDFFFLTWSEFICALVTVGWPLCEIL